MYLYIKHTHFQNKSYLEEVKAKAKRKGEAWLTLHAPLLASGATAQQTRRLPLPAAWLVSQSGRRCAFFQEESHQ